MKLTLPFADFKQISIVVSFSGDSIYRVEFVPRQCKVNSLSNFNVNSFPYKIIAQFEQYFLLPEFQFTLLHQQSTGTNFQQKVWQALSQIPVSEVVTYGQLAADLNSSPRAVGNACRKNPLPLIIPCHRVVSVSGIGGYAGDTIALQKTEINFLAIKQWLLSHEKAYFK
ncbi:MAG: methylated-DNA--[protein]-cysteine S-methyltransferase [gamma proteobacterium symbiont of Taylorina sp.]|nr:methylated-DNA--[protein]-cysteine S-methyltransferase [gamma proteobacterium symbiont of Taylorina sp.]